MNAHFFAAKRAFHATLRVARPILARLGLTPARFDLLYALAPCSYYRNEPRKHRQRDLRTLLGVSGATVCRMLQSLEKLGLIARSRSEGDKRQRYVRLTGEGLARVEEARESLIDSELVGFAVDCALGGEHWYEAGHCFREKDAAESVFSRIRRAFGDRATLYYPWQPDD